MISKSKIKLINSLSQKKYRDETGLFVAEGTKLISDLGTIFRCTLLVATAEWFRQNKAIMAKFSKAGVEPKKKVAETNALLQGKSFVFTGTMASMPRNTAKEIVESMGGTVLSNTTAKTTYVVAGTEPGSKLDKAISLGITVLTEDEFIKIIGR